MRLQVLVQKKKRIQGRMQTSEYAHAQKECATNRA